jgi:hypothetical protein
VPLSQMCRLFVFLMLYSFGYLLVSSS